MRGITRLIASVLLLIVGVGVSLPTWAQIAPTGTPPRTPLLPILITATPFGTPPPPPTATVFPIPPPTCAPALRFGHGQRVVLTPGINLRSQPTLSAPIVNYYTEEVVLTVLDGPTCAFGYNWWRVGGVGEPGWVIEGRPDRYFLGAAAGTPVPTGTLDPRTPTPACCDSRTCPTPTSPSSTRATSTSCRAAAEWPRG